MRYSQRVPDWAQHQVVTLPPCRCAGVGLDADERSLVEAVYGPVDPNAGLTAFAYLWRRYGPPFTWSDPDKELVSYILGTPHPEVWLTLSLKAAGLEYGAGYAITKTLLAAWHAPITAWEHRFKQWWFDTALTPEEQAAVSEDAEVDTPEAQALAQRYWQARCDRVVVAQATEALGPFPREHRQPEDNPVVRDALTASLQELLRPVFIRDVPITILGCLREDDPAAWPEGADAAPVSAYAGSPIPHAPMEAQLRHPEGGPHGHTT
jgi:hypothetical protein